MNNEEIRQRVGEHFKNGFHCSQVIMAVGQEMANIRSELLIKAVGAYVGGLAGTGLVCAALLASVGLISSLYSRSSVEENEDPRAWQLSNQLIKKFNEITREYGGINCSDIARVDWNDNEQVKTFRENLDSRRRFCLKVVEDTAIALGEILDQADAEAQ
jgi:C_GCAxxG_C_C family probable redox protein